MGKAVLISIKPKWVELIASGSKTIELRKTRPKIDTPFKCYIYCTKPSFEHDDFLVVNAEDGKARGFYGGSKIVGEFVCNEIMTDLHGEYDVFFEHHACVTVEEQREYAPDGALYGWHISELVIYDKPKELADFQRACNHKEDCCTCKRWNAKDYACISGISRPPQSWMYIEEL